MNLRHFSLRHYSTLVAVSVAISAPAFAADSMPSFTPREMAHCMMKRLRADTSKSYRDAFKACKEQFASTEADRSTETASTVANAEATKQSPRSRIRF